MPVPPLYLPPREYRPYNKGGTGRFEQTVNIQRAHNVHMPVHGDRHVRLGRSQARRRSFSPPPHCYRPPASRRARSYSPPSRYRAARRPPPDLWRWWWPPRRPHPPQRPVYYPPRRQRPHRYREAARTPVDVVVRVADDDGRRRREREARLNALVRTVPARRRGRSRVRTSWSEDAGRVWMAGALRPGWY